MKDRYNIIYTSNPIQLVKFANDMSSFTETALSYLKSASKFNMLSIAAILKRSDGEVILTSITNTGIEEIRYNVKIVVKDLCFHCGHVK